MNHTGSSLIRVVIPCDFKKDVSFRSRAWVAGTESGASTGLSPKRKLWHDVQRTLLKAKPPKSRVAFLIMSELKQQNKTLVAELGQMYFWADDRKTS